MTSIGENKGFQILRALFFRAARIRAGRINPCLRCGHPHEGFPWGRVGRVPASHVGIHFSRCLSRRIDSPLSAVRRPVRALAPSGV